MAVVACLECGGPVSELADQCPHCGCPASHITIAKKEMTPRVARRPIEPIPRKSRYQRVEENRLRGLGGWLILVGIGIVISPFFVIGTLLETHLPLFTDGIWAELTTPGTESYHAFWKPLLLGEVLFNLGAVVFSVHLIFFFFKRHYLFPKTYIAFDLIYFAGILLDIGIASLFLGDPILDAEAIEQVCLLLISGAIWIPYMLVSKRVKLTFVRGKPETENAAGGRRMFPAR